MDYIIKKAEPATIRTACLVIPALWGVVAATLFRRADKKKNRGPDVDYVI